MAFKKVKSYTYGDKEYRLLYDDETGKSRLDRKVFGLMNDVTVFEDGGFTVAGTDDSNLYSNGVSFESVQKDIITDLVSSHQKAG